MIFNAPELPLITSFNSLFPLDKRNLYDIPRTEIIFAATIAPVVYDGDGVTITRIHEIAVLKYGREVRLSEATNMQFA
jgi:hypothetical protein